MPGHDEWERWFNMTGSRSRSAPIARREMLKRCSLGALALAAPAGLSPVPTLAAESSRATGAASPTVAQDIARWVVDLRYDELPADVIARAKRVLLDSVGCILGAIGAEPLRNAHRPWRWRRCRA